MGDSLRKSAGKFMRFGAHFFKDPSKPSVPRAGQTNGRGLDLSQPTCAQQLLMSVELVPVASRPAMKTAKTCEDSRSDFPGRLRSPSPRAGRLGLDAITVSAEEAGPGVTVQTQRNKAIYAVVGSFTPKDPRLRTADRAAARLSTDGGRTRG